MDGTDGKGRGVKGLGCCPIRRERELNAQSEKRDKMRERREEEGSAGSHDP